MSAQFTHVCAKCQRPQDAAQFHRNASKPNGLSAWCKTCRKQFDGSKRAGYLIHVRNYHRRHRAVKLVGTIRNRAKKLGIPFDLNGSIPLIQARIDAGKCELTGVPFRLDAGLAFDSPSIDRIDPKLGYVYPNIRVVCFAMNCALNNWGEEVLLKVVTAWLAKRK